MKTILVVDDEFGIADALVTILEHDGYRVLTAANGRQALDRLAENRLDLVLADFMMPLLDGAALGSAMRCNQAYQDIPVIIMSAVGEGAVRCRFDGYQAFLRKPFKAGELLETVTRVLAQVGSGGRVRS